MKRRVSCRSWSHTQVSRAMAQVSAGNFFCWYPCMVSVYGRGSLFDVI